MISLYWPANEQMARQEPYFNKNHGKPRLDERRCGADRLRQPQRAALAG